MGTVQRHVADQMTDAVVHPHRRGRLYRLQRWGQDNWRLIVVAVPFIWLLVFFLAPIFIVAKISLAELGIGFHAHRELIQVPHSRGRRDGYSPHRHG